MDRIVTLDEFIIQREKDFPFATGELSGLLRDIGIAGKVINRAVNKAGLVNILGVDGSENSSGEEVQKLDMFANDKLIEFLSNSGECCGIASEELVDYIPLKGLESKDAKYVVLFDPLDGSSNIDVNVPIGTIFAIYRRVTEDGECTLEDFLQKGAEQVAAGYVVYGTSTILVYTTGNGVNGFTLDPSIGEFCLSHRNMKIPKEGINYSLNQGYYQKFEEDMRRYIDHCADQNLRLRYIGTMVADIHRTLIQGGIFLYPVTKKYPYGKLRLLYECNPIAFLVEQAGGQALDCKTMERILDIQPRELHQRSSIVVGSYDMVTEMGEFVKNFEPSNPSLTT